MEHRGRTRWRFLGLALAMAPGLSSCASLGWLQPEPPMTAENPPAPPAVVEPLPPVDFPELAMGPTIVDSPAMAEPQPASETQAASPAPQQRAQAPRRPPQRQRQASVQPPAPSPPAASSRSMEPAQLVGFNFDSVLEVLRQPDAVERNALSVVWTYAGSDCTLQLYFYPDIQTSVFRLLKYELKGSAGERLSESGACMQLAMRNGTQPRR